MASIIKTGILGGTFNPVHLGHLHLAQVAMQTLELNHLLFIPSYSPPHKNTVDLCSFQHRFAMLEIAVAPYPEFQVSNIEAQRDGFSYTIDTLRQLNATLGKDEELVFLMGFDAFKEMGTWKNYLQIPEYATIAVCARDGNDISGIAGRLFGDVASLIQEFHVPEKLVSSSEIRQLLANNNSLLPSLLPPLVFDYIKEHHLFAVA